MSNAIFYSEKNNNKSPTWKQNRIVIWSIGHNEIESNKAKASVCMGGRSFVLLILHALVGINNKT